MSKEGNWEANSLFHSQSNVLVSPPLQSLHTGQGKQEVTSSKSLSFVGRGDWRSSGFISSEAFLDCSYRSPSLPVSLPPCLVTPVYHAGRPAPKRVATLPGSVVSSTRSTVGAQRLLSWGFRALGTRPGPGSLVPDSLRVLLSQCLPPQLPSASAQPGLPDCCGAIS